MVSLKKLFFLGIALVSAVPLNSIFLHEPGKALVSRDIPPLIDHPKPNFDLHARQTPRAGLATLQWSPQGRIIFLASLKFPQAVLDGLYGLGEAGPGKALVDDFSNWIHAKGLFRSIILWVGGKKGGVYGKAGGVIADTYGFGFQTSVLPTAGEMQDLLDVIYAWASQFGETVRVTARPNDFFNLGTIGAGENTNLLQYATEEVPDIDINNQIRWAGLCDE